MKQVTASTLVPNMKHVVDSLTPASGERRLMKELKDIIRSDLLNRYHIGSPVFNTLPVASFLNPQFKQRHLQNKEGIVTRIIDECIGSFVSSETFQRESPPPAKKLKVLAAVLTDMLDNETTSETCTVLSPSEEINLEISYLHIPTLEMDAYPLAWLKF